MCVGHDTGVSMTVRYLSRIAIFSFAMVLLAAGRAEALPPTVGTDLFNLSGSLSNLPGLLSGVAYLLGLFFAVAGVFKFKDHVDGSGTRDAPVPLSAGVKRFLAGGMLFSLPFMSQVVKQSLVGGGFPGITYGALHPAPAGNGADAMVVKFITDITPAASFLLLVFANISALILLITAIVRLTKTSQEGPRGPGGLGTIMTFIASGALFSISELTGAFSSSIFGTSTTSTYANITVLPDPNDVAQVAPVVEAVMTFITIVGFIAFIRGWFVLKSFADGNSQASVAQALTFLIGGTMAINLGAVVNAVSQSLGINTITFS